MAHDLSRRGPRKRAAEPEARAPRDASCPSRSPVAELDRRTFFHRSHHFNNLDVMSIPARRECAGNLQPRPGMLTRRVRSTGPGRSGAQTRIAAARKGIWSLYKLARGVPQGAGRARAGLVAARPTRPAGPVPAPVRARGPGTGLLAQPAGPGRNPCPLVEGRNPCPLAERRNPCPLAERRKPRPLAGGRSGVAVLLWLPAQRPAPGRPRASGGDI